MIIDIKKANPLPPKQKPSRKAPAAAGQRMHKAIFFASLCVLASWRALWAFRLVQGRRIILTIFCLLAGAKFSLAQVAIIAHKAVPDDTLSQAQLLDFYSGEIKSWSNKVRVVVFDLKPAGEAKEAFYKLLGKTSSRMKSIWLKKLLMGEGDPPEALASEEEVLKRVASTPGAIGFVSKAKATPEVRIIVIVEKK
jgi:hypothetical protein